MKIKIWPYKRGGLEVDFTVTPLNGEPFRYRKASPFSSVTETRRWAQDEAARLRVSGKPAPQRKEEADSSTPEVPTLDDFAPRFMDYATTNNKPSEVRIKRQVLRMHLLPRIGSKCLNEITTLDVEAIKAAMLAEEYAPKSVNNAIQTFARR